MAGQNIAELAQWTTGMNEDDVRSSKFAWENVATALQRVGDSLKEVAPAIKEGFGESSDIGDQAPLAFTEAATKLEDQRKPLVKASDALGEVLVAMVKAKSAAGTKVEEPGPAPKQENYPGIPIVANVQFAVDTAKHVTEVAAYNAHDAEAGNRLAELKKSYAAAVAVFTTIHGDPYIPVDPDDSPGGTGPTGNRPAPGGGVKPVRPVGTITGDDDDDQGGRGDGDGDGDRDDPPRLPDRDPDNGVDENWPVFDPDPIGTDPTPTGPVGGTIGGPGGGGISPGLIGGGLAAGGALAAPGALKGLSGMLSRGSLSGAGTIGSSSRAGGPGALGRGGAATPGSPTARSGAGAGGRGAGGRAGTPGAQGGRGRGGAGGRGGRGAAGAAAGGRGRGKKDQEGGADRELYDDGQDWLDDEGAGPSVLG